MDFELVENSDTRYASGQSVQFKGSIWQVNIAESKFTNWYLIWEPVFKIWFGKSTLKA